MIKRKMDGILISYFYCYLESNKEKILNEAYALSTLTSSDDNHHIITYSNSWIEDGILYLVVNIIHS